MKFRFLLYFWAVWSAILLTCLPAGAQSLFDKARDLFRSRPAIPAPAEPKKESQKGESQKEGAQSSFILVLDAAHGGRDPGSKGPGFLEKDFTLNAVKLLAERLKRYPEIKIVFTREGDTDITAVRRAAVANFNKASLMVSINADGSWRPGVRGASILVSAPQRPPRVEGEAAQAVALRWQRGQNVFLADSLRFAKGLQNLFSEIQRGQKPEIHSLTLLALEGARMPAAYVNLGVISTPEEAARLREIKKDDPYLVALETEILRFARITPKPAEADPPASTQGDASGTPPGVAPAPIPGEPPAVPAPETKPAGGN